MKKKKVLITGASGFIGRNLTEFFVDKYFLLTPTHKQLDLLDADKVEIFLKKNKVDVVIHTALTGGSRPEEYQENMFYDNLKMFFNIARRQMYFGKMIHIGSGAEYGKDRSIIMVDEVDFDKRVPSDHYGFYKYICAKYIEQSENICNLRVFGLYGKYEDWRFRFISNAICRNLKGLPIEISKDVYFDYVFINDYCKIVEHFIENDGKFKSYNIGSGKRMNLVKIASMINQLSPNHSKVKIAKKGFKNEYSCSNKRLIAQIPDFKFIEFRQSLIELINWYTQNLKTINAKLL